MNKYFFQPEKKVMKQDFFMTDENKETVYEVRVLKQPLLGAADVEFVNHISGNTVQHKVGHVITMEQENNGLLDLMSKKSYFKYDGENIWDYLHDQGIRIETGLASGKLGMSYDVTLKGNEMAKISMASPDGGNSLLTGQFWLDVETEEADLDLAFLTAYAIARTEQVFYN